MELIRSKEPVINQQGAEIVPFLLPSGIDSFSLVEVVVGKKGHGRTKTTHADRILQVINGEGVLTINNNQHKAQPGSIYAIPKNSFYDYCATTSDALTVLVFDVPKYDPRFEVSG